MSRLEKVANVAIVLVCTVITADVVIRRLSHSTPSVATDNGRPNARGYAVGETFPTLRGLSLAGDKPSLILFVTKTCKFCTASMPFYQRLGQTVREHGNPVRLIGVCPEPTDLCMDYFKRHEVAIERVVTVAPGTATLKVAGTPTLLLVDQGRVASVWRGQLAPGGESEVLAAVTRSRSKP
jgi:thiol-disulfide isomerase/thioredoxin